MPTLFSLLLITFSYVVSINAVGTEEVQLPTLTLQLQSSTASNARNFLTEMLTLTTHFLDDQITNYFENTGKAEYFSHVGLSVGNYNLNDSGDLEEISIVEFEGTAFFNSLPVPSADLVATIVRNAFKTDSRLAFVESLTSSKDPLLLGLNFLVIGVDGTVVANDDLTLNSQTDDGDSSSFSSIAVIVGAATAAVCLVLAVAILYCLCKDRGDQDTVLEINNTKDQSSDRDLEQSSTRSPSPSHSIASQESSKFTYNPRSQASVETTTLGSKSLPSFPSNSSNLHVDVGQSIDVDAWKNSTISPITPAPFGHDISAIDHDLSATEDDKRDLSLIEEGRDEDPTPVSKKVHYLSKDALSRLDRRDVDPVKWDEENKKEGNRVNDDSYHSLESSYDSEGSDVINDLKNLSVQIHKHRASYR